MRVYEQILFEDPTSPNILIIYLFICTIIFSSFIVVVHDFNLLYYLISYSFFFCFCHHFVNFIRKHDTNYKINKMYLHKKKRDEETKKHTHKKRKTITIPVACGWKPKCVPAPPILCGKNAAATAACALK